MPVPSASLTPDETVQWSPSGPTALALTTSGALRVQRPRGPLVQAGTVNLITNPVLAESSGVWGGLGGNIANRTRKLSDGVIATYCLDGVATASGWQGTNLGVHTLLPSTVYTVSIWAKAISVVHQVPFMFYFPNNPIVGNGGNGIDATVIDQRGDWKRYAVTVTSVASPPASNFGACFRTGSIGDHWQMTGGQLEFGAVATELVDPNNPDDPDTYWLGTPNASPSVRPDRYAEMPLGWLVEEATTNYDPNPISASVVHPFNGYAHISGSRITNAGLNHPTAGLINTAARITIVNPIEHTSVVGTTAGNAASLGYSIAVGAVATQQIWFRASPKWIGKTLYVVFSKIGGTGQSITKPVIATGDWQYADLTLTVTIEGGTAFYVYINSAADMIGDANMVGEWIDFTATQLEQKAYATSLAVHTMGAGYSLGAENVTNRAVATPYVTLPMPADQGSIYVRYLAGSTPTSRHIGGFGQIGGAGSRALIPNISSGNQMNLRQGQDFHGLATVAGWNQPRSVYAEYFGTQVAVDYRDGVGRRVFTRTGNPPPPTWTDDMIPIGWSGTATAELPLNGYVFAVAAFPRQLISAELASLDAIPTEDLSYASIVGIGPQLGGLLLTHPDPGFAVLRTHGGS